MVLTRQGSPDHRRSRAKCQSRMPPPAMRAHAAGVLSLQRQKRQQAAWLSSIALLYASQHSNLGDIRHARLAQAAPKNPLILVGDDGITVAGGLFEPTSIADDDDATCVANEPRSLRHARRDRNGWSAHAEHLRQVPVRQRKPVQANTVVRHQQPARTALLYLVQTSACDP